MTDAIFHPDRLLSIDGLTNGHSAFATPPSGDPRSACPVEPGLEAEDFGLPADGLSPAERRRALSRMELYLADKRDHMLGYQANQDMNG